MKKPTWLIIATLVVLFFLLVAGLLLLLFGVGFLVYWFVIAPACPFGGCGGINIPIFSA